MSMIAWTSLTLSLLQDPNVKLIRELRAEIRRLKAIITSGRLVSYRNISPCVSCVLYLHIVCPNLLSCLFLLYTLLHTKHGFQHHFHQLCHFKCPPHSWYHQYTWYLPFQNNASSLILTSWILTRLCLQLALFLGCLLAAKLSLSQFSAHITWCHILLWQLKWAVAASGKTLSAHSFKIIVLSISSWMHY